MNDVGMVAWFITLRTPEYPEGRQAILIANDITHQVTWLSVSTPRTELHTLYSV